MVLCPAGSTDANQIHSQGAQTGVWSMNPSDRKQLFDNWAHTYDESVRSPDGTFPFDGYDHVLDTVVELAAVAAHMRVLDLGVGSGNLAARFVERGC